jgi:hypothetical protein
MKNHVETDKELVFFQLIPRDSQEASIKWGCTRPLL